MPSNTIDQSFIEEFEAGVHTAYQRKGSMLRNTVRYRGGVKNKTTFQKVGTGSATQKGRTGLIPAMNVDHSKVSVTTQDWYAGEWIDDLDLLRVNHDEMIVAQDAGAWALGRKTDELLITAMSATTKTSDETTNGITLAWATGIMATFGETEVPDDGDRVAVIGWKNWGQLMGLAQFASQDYVPTEELPFTRGTMAKRWLSFLWVPYSGLSLSGDDRVCYVYHKMAAGIAVGADVQSSIQYYNERDSHFALNKMQMNAVLIDENGVYKCALDE